MKMFKEKRDREREKKKQISNFIKYANWHLMRNLNRLNEYDIYALASKHK